MNEKGHSALWLTIVCLFVVLCFFGKELRHAQARLDDFENRYRPTIEPDGGGRVKWKQISHGRFKIEDRAGNFLGYAEVKPDFSGNVIVLEGVGP